MLTVKEFTTISLGKDMVRKLKQGHRWLFEDCFNLKKKPQAGLAILEFKGSPLAIGIVQPDSSLTFRALCLLSPGQKPLTVLQDYVTAQWQQTLALRMMYPNQATDSFRLVNGDGDGLPGLVIDIYRNVAVIKHDHSVMEKIWNHGEIVSLLRKQYPSLSCVYLKRANREEEKGESLFGELPSEVQFLENHATFSSNIRDAAKTGFFLDQRDNRLLLKNFSKNRSVLNVFSYTGGFSVLCALGGAKSVTSVDIAPKAILAANLNMKLNGMGHLHHGITIDAFQFLDQAAKEKKQWDLVITDPPSFAPNHKALPQAIEAYTRVFSTSLRLTTKGSLFAASSCSSHLTYEKFLEICQDAFSKTRRAGSIIYLGGQAADHPYPLAMSELRYLKFALFRIDRLD